MGDAFSISCASEKSMLSAAKNTDVPFLRKSGTYNPLNRLVFSTRALSMAVSNRCMAVSNRCMAVSNRCMAV